MMMPFRDLIINHNLKIKGVLHLGSSFCQERKEYLELGCGRVVWVEAIKDVYEVAKKNLEDYPNQEVFNYCLSNVDGEEVTFNISNNESQSSSMLELGVHKQIHPEVHYINSVKIKTNRIDTLVNNGEINIQGLNFLNVDLQGAEAWAIEGMGNCIKQFEYVLAEVNKVETYVGCMTIEDFDYFMLQRGFERVETGVWVGDVWTDSLYKRFTNI